MMETSVVFENSCKSLYLKAIINNWLLEIIIEWYTCILYLEINQLQTSKQEMSKQTNKDLKIKIW